MSCLPLLYLVWTRRIRDSDARIHVAESTAAAPRLKLRDVESSLEAVSGALLVVGLLSLSEVPGRLCSMSWTHSCSLSTDWSIHTVNGASKASAALAKCYISPLTNLCWALLCLAPPGPTRPVAASFSRRIYCPSALRVVGLGSSDEVLGVAPLLSMISQSSHHSTSQGGKNSLERHVDTKIGVEALPLDGRVSWEG